jgi:PhnB protein
MQPTVKAIPNGMHTITPHIIVRDAARAVEWYKEALGAEERSRVPLPWRCPRRSRGLLR